MQGELLYGPYGNQRYSSGTLPTSIGFTGQRADSVTGLDYYVARYYDPAVGVFLSPDSVQGNAQGMQPYSYVGDDPESRTDPTGNRFECPNGCGSGGDDGGGDSTPQSVSTSTPAPVQIAWLVRRALSPVRVTRSVRIMRPSPVRQGMSHRSTLLPIPPRTPVRNDSDLEYVEGYTLSDKAVDPQALLRMATRNFSAYFPFGGCGSQITVGMICTLDDHLPGGAPIKVLDISATSFTFLSLPGHPEGADRMITFAFRTDSNGHTDMTVWSRGPSSIGAVGTILTNAEYYIWGFYAGNLSRGIQDGDIHNYENGDENGGGGNGSLTV